MYSLFYKEKFLNKKREEVESVQFTFSFFSFLFFFLNKTDNKYF